MAYREFRDQSGTPWTAWDTYPQSAERTGMDTLRDGWLTFESEAERRRLAPAPGGWFVAPEERLLEWLAEATPARLRLDANGALLESPATAPTHPGEPALAPGESLPEVTEGVRDVIEKSRHTIEDLTRAIEEQANGEDGAQR